VLRKAGALTEARGAAARLPQGLLDATRMKDANQHEPNRSVVTSVEFHPSGHVLLSAGLDKHLRLFNVDGVRNPKLQSVFFQDAPLHQAAFCLGGGSVLCTGRRPYFYLYDVDRAQIDRIQGIVGR